MLDFRKIKVVVFDLDDTLFKEKDYVISGFRSVDSWLQDNYCVEGFLSLALERFGRGERGHIFDDVLKEIGINVPVSGLVKQYREHEPIISLGDQVAKSLSELKMQGKELAIITDGYLDVQRKKVKALGLHELVDFVVFSDTWGRNSWKPNRKPFDVVMKEFRKLPEEYVYIGDNPAKDFMGARNVGWQSVRLRIAGREHAGIEAEGALKADFEIGSWEQLSDLLAFQRG